MIDLLDEITALEVWLLIAVLALGAALGVVVTDHIEQVEALRTEMASQKEQAAYAYDQLAHDMAINYMLCKEGISHEH